MDIGASVPYRGASAANPGASAPYSGASTPNPLTTPSAQENEKQKEKLGLSLKPVQPDPLQWITWYISSKHLNSCLIVTPYVDFELSIQETKSKTSAGKTMRLLHLCMYRVDGQPVPGTTITIQTINKEAIASFRRLSVIEHALKEIKQQKKENTENAIHGLVVYRLNFELLLEQNTLSYKSIVERLQAQHEQVFEDTIQAVIYVKT
jgi:hypothetical protein